MARSTIAPTSSGLVTSATASTALPPPSRTLSAAATAPSSVDVCDHHARACPREALGDSEPYAPRSPGNDRDPSWQL